MKRFGVSFACIDPYLHSCLFQYSTALVELVRLTSGGFGQSAVSEKFFAVFFQIFVFCIFIIVFSKRILNFLKLRRSGRLCKKNSEKKRIVSECQHE